MTDYTRNMLMEIRKRTKQQVDLPKGEPIVEKQNLNNRFSVLMEEAVADVKKNFLREEEEKKSDDNVYVVRKLDTQFGSTRQTQEATIRKTIGDVEFKEDALKYYPEIKDLAINGELNGLGLTFQFRYKDPSGDGCYIWADGLQLSDANTKTVEKIRDAFQNWKQSLVDDGDLMSKLDREANRNK